MTVRNRNTAIGIAVVVLGMALSMSFSLYHPFEHKPPKFQIQNQVWPSCHWEGSQDQNDWQVEFVVEDWGRNKAVWRQWVAAGISEKAAEQLCDAYVGVIDPNKPEAK